MLLIGREERQGLYIGRGIRVTVTGVAPPRNLGIGLAKHSILGNAMQQDADLGRAELTIEHPAAVVVSGPEVGAGDHVRRQAEAEAVCAVPGDGVEPSISRIVALWLERRASVLIGRGIRIVIVEVQSDGMVRLGIEAPGHVAVSRDDFTIEEHLRFQSQRESGARGRS